MRKEIISDEIFFHHTRDEHPTSYKKHWHNKYEIYLFIEGSAEYIVEGKKYLLKPRDLLILRPRSHHFPNIIRDLPYERFSLHFPLDDDSPLAPNILKDSSEVCYHLPQGSPIIEFMYRLSSYASLPENEKTMLVRSLLNELLILLGHLDTNVADATISSPLISQIINFINDNIGETEALSLDNLANNLYLNKFYIAHAFKAYMGLSIGLYIRQRRLLLANNLIKKGYSLKDAAIQSGFGDYSAFYRTFISLEGYKPSTKNII